MDGYLDDVIARFAELKKLAEKAVEQTDEDKFFYCPDPESNSIAITMKHLAGNMKSRWTDFLTTDGEKPDRNRDTEFETVTGETRGQILAAWDEGWEVLFRTMRSLKPADLTRTVPIRNEPHVVFQAINRQLLHYGYHVGQIVYLARHLAWQKWNSLSVPRGGSRAFNQSKNLSPDQ